MPPIATDGKSFILFQAKILGIITLFVLSFVFVLKKDPNAK